MINVKMHIRGWVLGLLTVVSLFSSCKPDEKPCVTPADTHDSVETEHLWMLRYKLGDTLRMNMYRINRDSGRRYEFIKEVEYVAVDSGMKMGVSLYPDPDNCEAGYYSYGVYTTFEGPSKLELWLSPQGSFDWLSIHFYGKAFRINNSQYNYRGSNWWSTLEIGGKEYKDVNHLFGDNDGAVNNDSLSAFYNTDYGILKIILNDTLAFIRKP